MKTWEELYGQDADGNRGTKVTMWELEDTQEERNEIAELLILKGLSIEDTGSTEVELDGIDIPVTIEEYHDEMRGLENGNK